MAAAFLRSDSWLTENGFPEDGHRLSNTARACSRCALDLLQRGSDVLLGPERPPNLVRREVSGDLLTGDHGVCEISAAACYAHRYVMTELMRPYFAAAALRQQQHERRCARRRRVEDRL